MTMYRLMLYYLIFLAVIAVVLGNNIIFQTLFLVLVCYLFNKLFAKVFQAPTNFESFVITALILSLIIGPTTNLLFLTSAAIFAMGSKYLLAINKRHLFNPAAIAVVLTAVLFNQGASWWIGTPQMIVPITLGGLLILKKIRRFTLVTVFLLATFLNPALFFFAFVMLTEPQTSPPTKNLQIIYAALVAFLFAVYSHLSISFPLELALISGNLFSFFATPHFHLALRLKSKAQLAPDIIQFSFLPDKKFSFLAGQYLEITLPHSRPDSRGTRRFFTISSSPTEKEITITSKFVPNGSSFKKALFAATPGTEIIATSPAGDFVLSKNPNQKLAFIAGGIGITPFRSMARPDIPLLYAAVSKKEFVFKDFFPKAAYKVGRLEESDIKKAVPDYKERLFYVSGPEPMVEATEKMLVSLGVSRFQIKRDYFPGYQA